MTDAGLPHLMLGERLKQKHHLTSQPTICLTYYLAKLLSRKSTILVFRDTTISITDKRDIKQLIDHGWQRVRLT